MSVKNIHFWPLLEKNFFIFPNHLFLMQYFFSLQLIADFEEQGGPRSHHNGGDGQSVSSTGTGSPDIFAAELANHKPNHHRGYSFDSQNDVIVTDIDISSGKNLVLYRIVSDIV
jgi:hypothetical protein